MDGSYCNFEGGDDPTEVISSAFPGRLPSNLSHRMASTQILTQVVIKVGLVSHCIRFISSLDQVPSLVVLLPLPSSYLFLTTRMRQVSQLNMRIVSVQSMQRSAALVPCHLSLFHGFQSARHVGNLCAIQ